MRTTRLHLDAPLASGTMVTLPERQAHQLRHVLRLRSGDLVHLFNAHDGEWRAELVLERRQSQARPLVQTRSPAVEPGPVLAFALLKRAKLELVVEKATELGVSALQPLRTEHAVVDRLNAERLTLILAEAAEQSERLTVPVLHPLRALDDWLAERSSTHPLYAALERAAAPSLARALQDHGEGDFLIGPEGGFAAGEHQRLGEAPRVVPVSLGARILRAETAAIVGLGAMTLRISR